MRALLDAGSRLKTRDVDGGGQHLRAQVGAHGFFPRWARDAVANGIATHTLQINVVGMGCRCSDTSKG